MSKEKARRWIVEITSRGVITIPRELRNELLSSLVEIRRGAGGTIELVPQVAVDADQAWFWSERWQDREKDADDDIRGGRIRRFDSADELLAALDDR